MTVLHRRDIASARRVVVKVGSSSISGDNAEKIGPTDRQLDLGAPLDAWRRVRALSPAIGARAVIEGRELIVWRAHLEEGSFVPDEVQPAGGRRMGYAEFVRGLRS